MQENALAFAEIDFDEFDPLAVDDEVIDQENMDDDNPLDTIDYPTLRNMPDDAGARGAHKASVYTPERAGSARDALLSLFDHNPARRPVLLSIIGWCEGGIHASELAVKVNEAQKSNRSVYSASTLARMLERAGALTLEMPEATEAHEDIAANADYLSVPERIDPVWRATAEGLAVREELTGGAAFRDIVLTRDVRYIEVYRAVMESIAAAPRSKDELEMLVDSFSIVQSPRRFAGHFLDMLEKTDAIEWTDRAWHITELGRSLLGDVAKTARAHAQNANKDTNGKEAAHA